MDLQHYLSQKFQGRDSFLENIVFPIFGEDNFDDKYDIEILDDEDLKGIAQRTGIKSVIQYGTINVGHTTVDIFDVTVHNRVEMRRNRVGIQQLIRRIMNTYSSAFIIFHYENTNAWDWRFSYCQKDDKEITEAKRYTFILGPGQSCRTAAQNFDKLISLHGNVDREDIVRAFDVEALSKEFFTKYKQHYERFCNFVYENKDNRNYFGVEFSMWENKIIRDYVKKLLGRIVFLHFLQKKGWLGVPADKEWGAGDSQFMKNLFAASSQAQKDNYLDQVLEPLFADALNTRRKDDLFDLHVDGYRNVKIPYLNGGLFEREKLDEPKSTFPAEYFEDLFEFFYQYNFTIDENDPNDAEVGVDPEMLGHIFENLLEDNKDKGAFYTPKEIVQYMCRESLIAYLSTCVMKKHGEKHAPEAVINMAIRRLLNEPEAIVPRMSPQNLDDFGEYIRNVKICDPAIGSGAFPMGLLNELVRCRTFINAWAKDDKGNILTGDYAALKADIICNNIYGVDIEKGAIDIARLRFWLSIIVDEQTPHALPNFDYKFMQGNSLVSTFGGQYVELNTSDFTHDNTTKMTKVKTKIRDLKRLFYKSSEDDKLRVNIQIKDNILHLISLQLGYEIDTWKLNHAEQLSFLFPDQEKVTTAEAISQMPEERQKIMRLGKQLRTRLANTSLSLQERSQTDIRFFDWRMMFTEVFDVKDKNGGFDIVIGNPPYISAPAQIANPVLAQQRADIIASRKFSTLYQKWDLYIPFIEHGIQLACKGGIVSMIVPYPLTNQTYGKKLREKISNDYDMFELCDLNGTKIFENATVSNCIPFVRKTESTSGLTIISHINDNKKITKVFKKTVDELMPDKKTSVWNVEEETRNTNRHSDLHVLGDFCYISVGMVVNADEKTAKGEFKKEDLISENEDDIHCRKYIEAKDMEKYHVKRLRFLEYNTTRCPGQLRRPTFKELYEYPRLIMNCLGTINCTIDDIDNYLHNHSIYCAVPWHSLSKIHNKSISSSIKKFSKMLRYDMELLSETVNLKFLLGILNSKYADILLTNLRGGDYHIYPEHIRNIPIPNATKDQQQPIIDLVDLVLSSKKQNPSIDTSSLESQIDQLVYQLYDLTPEEIAIVENSSK